MVNCAAFSRSLPEGTSAAQNGPVIQTCTQCGAVNEGYARACCFCDAQFARGNELPAAGVVSRRCEPGVTYAAARNASNPEHDWRRELSHRLSAYRARRRRLCPDDSQAVLPFRDGNNASHPELHREARASLPQGDTAGTARNRPAKIERAEIAVAQPELDFAAAEQYRSGPSVRFSVAALSERRRAGLFDGGVLLFAYIGFLALFRSLGGEFSFGKFDALIYAATIVLFYAQYFTLFNVFGCPTPGMLLRGLRVVSFDGGAPTQRQLLWRSFGYLISAGTVFFGFLWALWDEDHLTWQDRISQTYVTHSPGLNTSEPLVVAQKARGAF